MPPVRRRKCSSSRENDLTRQNKDSVRQLRDGRPVLRDFEGHLQLSQVAFFVG